MGKNYKFGTVQAISAEFCAEEGKTPYVLCDIKFTDSDKHPEIVGKVVKQAFSLSEKAAKYSAEHLRSLGWSCNDITELTGVGDIQARGGLYVDHYNGEDREKVGIWPMKARPKLDNKVKNSFAKKFKQLAASVDIVEVSDENRALDRSALPDAPVMTPQEDDPFAQGGDDDIPW